MKTCSEFCSPICDFCKFLQRKNQYSVKGFCTLHNEVKYIDDQCSEFICFRIKEKINNNKILEKYDL